MDAILKQAQDVFEGQIDFEGQKLTETVSTVLLIIISLVGLIVGYIQQDIHLTMWICLAGTLATLLIVTPSWPIYNQNPLPWIGTRTKVPQGGIVITGLKSS